MGGCRVHPKGVQRGGGSGWPSCSSHTSPATFSRGGSAPSAVSMPRRSYQIGQLRGESSLLHFRPHVPHRSLIGLVHQLSRAAQP